MRTGALPKPGGGTRRRGMPTVLARVIAPAILPGRGPRVDPAFSARREGCRPGRRAHQALQPRGHAIDAGSRGVVTRAREKCFDQVPHDMGRSRGARTVQDTRLLTRLRRSLNAGLMPDGWVSQREAGMPHGRPRSPLLSKGLLADVDQALERRGHRCGREADEATVSVRRRRASERVLASRTRCLAERLRLQVHRSQRVVARPWPGTGLGDTVTNHRRPGLKPAPRSVTRAQDRRRRITPHGRGRHSRPGLTERTRVPRGGVGACRRSTVTHQVEGRDPWRRRRVRQILWEPWRHPRTRSRQLVAMGRAVERARTATATGRGAWWPAGASPLHAAVKHRGLAAWGLWRLLAPRRDLERST